MASKIKKTYHGYVIRVECSLQGRYHFGPRDRAAPYDYEVSICSVTIRNEEDKKGKDILATVVEGTAEEALEEAKGIVRRLKSPECRAAAKDAKKRLEEALKEKKQLDRKRNILTLRLQKLSADIEALKKEADEAILGPKLKR